MLSKSIQLITSKEYETKHKNIKTSTYVSPCSLDEFDINIIDLSDESLWVYDGNAVSSINQVNNLRSIKEMVRCCKTSKVIYVLPQNIKYKYHFLRTEKRFNDSALLKDNLYSLLTILSEAAPKVFRINNTHANPYFELKYENTYTEIQNHKYQSAFHFAEFITPYYSMTQSSKSDKHTTIYTKDDIYFTALNVTSTEEDMLLFIDFLFPDDVEPRPDWFDSINFDDDTLQRQVIIEKEQVIKEANDVIANAKARLEENNKFKSILYTNDNELVGVVFQMLERLLDCDLSGFEDKKVEDFIVKKDNITFIGEIKGVSSNVKNDHIGQIEHHYQRYIDELEEQDREENVRALLIISPFRSKNPTEREPIHDKQIKLAKRNGCLIIETNTLLRIFEAFQQGAITSEKCIDVFSKNTGLLDISDFN